MAITDRLDDTTPTREPRPRSIEGPEAVELPAGVGFVEEWVAPDAIDLDAAPLAPGRGRRRSSPVWRTYTEQLAAGEARQLLTADADRVQVLVIASLSPVTIANTSSDVRSVGQGFPLPSGAGVEPLVLDGWTGEMWARNDNAGAATVALLVQSYPSSTPLFS